MISNPHSKGERGKEGFLCFSVKSEEKAAHRKEKTKSMGNTTP